MTRIWRTTGIGAVAILCFSAASCSSGASSISNVTSRAAVGTHSGTIRLFESVRLNNRGSAVVTGVIADSGKSVPTDRNGHAKTNGRYEELILKHGSIRLDERARSNQVPSAHFNRRTCSGSLRSTAKIPVLGGTGAYAGISGSINDVVNAGFDLPRHKSGPKKGRCAGIASATASFGSEIGVGSVTF